MAQVDEGATAAPAGESVADLQAKLAAAQAAEAVAAEPEPLSLESLDRRVSEVERRLHGGAVE